MLVAWMCAAAVGTGSVGCAHHAGAIAGQMAEEAPEPLIRSTVETLGDEETQAAIAEVLASPEVQTATRELIGNVTDGTLDALTDEERAARLEAFSERFVARVSNALAGSIERDVGPALAQVMSRTLDQSLQRVLSEESTDRMAAAVSRVAQQSVVAMAAGMREELGPAMRATLREELVPALNEALAHPDTQRTIALTTRTLSREMVLGVQDAFAEIEARDPEHRTDTVITRLQDWAGEGSNTLQIILVLMVLGLLAMVAWQMHTTARAKAQEAQAHRREAAIVALTEALRNAQSRPETNELLDALERAFHGKRERAFLRDLLQRSRRGGGPGDEPGGGGGGGTPQPAGT